MKYQKALPPGRIVNMVVTVLFVVSRTVKKLPARTQYFLAEKLQLAPRRGPWTLVNFLTAVVAVLAIALSGLTPVQAATKTNGWCAANVDNTTDVAVYDDGSYCYVAFKNTSITYVWTPPTNVSSIDLLVVAGGGGGASRHAAGGGAGGLIQQSGYPITSNSITIAVGAGGAGGAGGSQQGYNGTKGSNSSISGTGVTTKTATGGGGGVSMVAGGSGSSGGSGGGGSCCGLAAGTGEPGQGNSGSLGASYSPYWWVGGGGGGAGAAGSPASSATGGKGGDGAAVSWISTTASSALAVGEVNSGAVYFAGGGGGGTADYGTGGARGIGGGTAGASNSATVVNGSANTGGGGGGGGIYSNNFVQAGGNGGSGVVVVRYARTSPEIVVPGVTNALVNLDATQSISYSGTGTTWTDLSGNGNNATVNGSPTFSTNKFSFDSNAAKYVTAGIGTPDFSKGITVSVTADFGSSANNWERLIDFGSGAQNNNILFARNGTSSDLSFQIYNGTSPNPALTCSAPGAITSGLKEYRAVLDGTNCKLYVGGDLKATVTTNVLPVNTARASSFIGKSNWADAAFEGSIQKVSVYNYPIASPDLGACEQQYSGSTLVTSVTLAGNDCVVKFTSGSGSWVAPRGVSNIRALIIGGGGAGGGGIGGGGGAGEMVEAPSLGVTPGSAYTVTVGAGGATAGLAGNPGANSVFDSITGYGGGGGGTNESSGPTASAGTAGKLYGSGGGGGYPNTWISIYAPQLIGISDYGTRGFPAGVTGYHDNGGPGSAGGGKNANGGGGGGAGGYGGAATLDAGGVGGTGRANDITGTSLFYAGGGGGGINGNPGTSCDCTSAGLPGLGGSGVGGNAGVKDLNGDGFFGDPGIGSAGTSNTGSGGGGGSNTASGAGGSGVVIVRYTPQKPTSLLASPKTGSTTEIDLSWSAPAASGTPSGYRIEKSATGDNYWSVATTSTAAASSTSTTTTVTGLTSGTTYDFRVVPYYSGATSLGIPSATSSAKTNLLGSASIANLTATTSGATFTVTSTGVATITPTASVGGVSKTVSAPVGGVYTVSGVNPGEVVDISVSFVASAGYTTPATVTARQQALAVVTLSNLTQTYNGSARPVTATTTPSGRTVNLSYSNANYTASATAPTAPGSYTVTATLSDGTYTGSATGTLVISKASQSTVSVTGESTIVYGSTRSLTASGGSGSTANYTFVENSDACSISGAILTPISVGDCVVYAYRAGDDNYNNSANSANFTISITPKPLTLSVSPAPTSRPYSPGNTSVILGPTTIANVTGLISGHGLTVDHTKLTGTISTADVGTSKAVSVNVASGYLVGPNAANYQLPTISNSPVVTITKIDQDPLSLQSALTTIFGQNISISATGGSGTGALTFATSSGACQVATSIITPVSAGTCVVVATKDADTNYNAVTAQRTITIDKADQAAVSVTGGSTVVYGSTLTVGAQGGSGTGAYILEARGVCTVSGFTITPTGVGDCFVKAKRETNPQYNESAWSVEKTVTVTAKPLTVVVTPFPSSREYSGSTTAVFAALQISDVTGIVAGDNVTIGNFVATGTVADAEVGENKPITTTLSGALGGTKAGNYQTPTVSNSPVLTITKATQSAVSLTSDNTVVYGSSLSLAASDGNGDGAYEFRVVSPGKCTISGSSLTASSVGTCEVEARRLGNSRYNVSAWSTAQTVTVTAKPLTLAVTVSPASRAYNTTRDVALATTSASNLTGIINSDDVSVDHNKLSATVANAVVGDSKTVTVVVGSDYLTGTDKGNYLLPTVSGSPTINIVKADQGTVSVTSGTTFVYGGDLDLSASGGDGTSGYEYRVVGSSPCSVSSGKLVATGVGTCDVQSRRLSDTNYNVSAWSSSVTVTVTPKPLTLSVTVDPSSRPYNTSTLVDLSETSASNLTGIINSDTVTTDDDKLSGAISSANVGTNKAVTVTVATGFLTGAQAANYFVSSVTGSPVVTITQASQGPLAWGSALATVYGETFTLSATGGSGTGALSYATTGGPCTVASSIVTPTSVGTCVVVVTKASDDNYIAQTLSGNLVISQASQSAVTVTSASTVVYGTPLTLTASGGDGAGAFDFDVVRGDCTLTGDVLTAGSVGDCEVKARKLSSTNYVDSSWSSAVTVSVTAKPITVTVAPVDRQWNGGTGVSLTTTTASSLTGIESGDTVTVDHNKLSASIANAAVGANKAVTVTVAAGYLGGLDASNYQLPTIAGSPTVNITRANQSALSFTSDTSMFYGQSITLAASGGTGAGALSYDVVSGSCTDSSGTLTASAAGDCVIRATKAQDSTYLAETVEYTVTVVSATQATVSVSSSNTVVYGQTQTLTISGGSGSGTADYERVSGPCSISGDTLSTTGAGDCVIHARKLTDGSYFTSAWSADYTITVTPKPITLSVTVAPASRAYNTTRDVAIEATSASNLTGVINSDSVTTDDSKLSATVSAADVGTNKAVTVALAPGYLTGPKAGNYNIVSVTGTPVLTITQASQGPLSWATALSTVYGEEITLSATGGTGTGALSYAKTSGPCTVASSIVTPTSVGTCVVLVTRAADTNYTAQTLSGDVAIGQATQSTVSLTSESTVVYGSTLTLTASGGDGDGAYEFSDISGNCDVTGNVLTPLAVGNCEIHVRKLSSTNYLTSAWSTNVTVTMTPKPLTVTVSPVTRQYDGLRNITLATTTAASLNGVEADDVLTVDHSQLSATVATAAVGSNKAVSVIVGSSYLSGAARANYQLPTVAGSPVVEITRANQDPLSFTSAVSTTYGIDVPLSVSGGTGTGSVTYDVDSGPCTVSGSALAPTASGTCAVTATKAQDSTYLAETVTYSVVVAAADQAIVSVSNANTVVYGSPLTLTATGGTGSGAFEYAPVSGPCAVSGSTLSVSAVGTCVVHARKLGDSGYSASAWSADFSVTITPKPLTVSVSVSPASRPYDTSTVATLDSTSASNLTGIINNDSVGTDDSKLSASISTADVATNKAVTVAVATGFLTGTHAANYLLPTVTGSPVLTVTQTNQAALSWQSPLTTVYGQDFTLSATGGSGTGALTFAKTSGPCTVASSIVTPTSVGTCVVLVTRAADTNYTAQTLSGDVTIGQAAQSAVTMTNVTTVVYGSTLTLTATGGDGSGDYEFDDVIGQCSVVNGELTPLGVGDCVVHARKLSSTNFAASAWSADQTISMTPKPLTVAVSPQNRQWNGDTSVALAATTAADLSGVEGIDTVGVDPNFLTASVATADVGANKPVTVAVAAGYLTGADAVKYLLPTIAGSPTVTISRASQAALSFTSQTSTTFGQTLALATSGGTGTGSTSYAVDSGPCDVTGSTLTSTAAGTCSITATKAQDANYSATTVTTSVTVAFADQSAVSITSDNTVVYGSTLSLTATGGTGTGSYLFSPVSGPCTISGSTLSTDAVGDCVFKARKQADSGYNASAWTTNFTVSITPKPLTLSVTVDPSSREYNTSRTVVLAPTSAANLTGIINSDVVTTDDSKLSALVPTADVATNKAVTVLVAPGYLTGAHAGNYQLPTVTGNPVLTITRTAQSAITVTSALNTIFGMNISLSATGGSGTGALTFAKTTGPCFVAASIMTPTSAGSCVVLATSEGDTNYFAQTQSATIDIAAATQAPVTMTSATTVVYGSTLNLTASGGTGTGAYEFVPVSGGACVVTNGDELTPLSVGECVVHARKAGDASYAISSWSADVTITITPKPLTLNVTVSPGLRQYNGSSVVALETTTVSNLVGIELSDEVSVDHSKLVATVATPAVGENKPVTVVVQPGYLVGPASGNYQLPTIAGSPLLTITQTNQTGISFANASSVPFGQSLNLVASGGSGSGALTIARTSGPCEVTNNVMTSTGVGTCAVTATRASDATYLVESTTANITITQAAQTLNFTSSIPEDALPQSTYTPVAVSSGGTAVSLNITNGLATVCSMSNGVVTFLARGQCVITASQAGTSNYLAATSISQTIVAGMLNQSITFPAITDRDLGSAAFSASASVNSGLTLSYSSTTGSICSVDTSGLITPSSVGTCSVTVSQPLGNDVYAPASPVTRTFRVLAIVPTAPQVTSVSSGDSSITVAFTAPSNRGGVPITNYVLTATPASGPVVVKSNCAAVPVSTPPACTITGLTNGVDYTVAMAATNSAGTGPSSNSSPSLAPATAPDSVTSLAAVPGNTTLTATWRPPTSLGGGTFSRYELTLTPRGGTPLPTVMLYSSTANRYAFTGLTNGVAYDLEVLVISSANTSDMGSNRATAIGIPATESTAPRKVTAQATSSTTALVSWEVPLSNGGSPISGYSVSPAGCVFASPTATRCEYRNLAPRSTFTVSVIATNVMGGSVAAETSVTMPDTPAAPVVVSRAATPAPVAENIVTPAVLSAIPEFKNAPYPGMQFDAPRTGNVVAMVDGNAVEAWMSVSGQTVTVQTEQGVRLTVQNSENSTTSGSSLVLNPGSALEVEVNGYTPGSPLEAWMFSTPVRLGEGVADETGSFTGEFPLSSSAQPGQHTVVFHGMSSDGEVLTVAIGVKVVETARAPEPQSSSTGTFMGYALLGLLLMTALVLLVIRRRESSGE